MKFHEVLIVQASPTTAEAVTIVGALYSIEDEIHDKPARHSSRFDLE
jgi:hypothetical protein